MRIVTWRERPPSRLRDPHPRDLDRVRPHHDALGSVRGEGRTEIALRHGGDSRLALLNNERRKEFQRGGAVVDADVNLASINIERLSRFIGGRRATFMFKGQRSFQDVARQRTGMCVPDLACARRELQNVDDRLVAGRSVLLKQRLALDSGLLRREPM